jgi:hypothetical protein
MKLEFMLMSNNKQSSVEFLTMQLIKNGIITYEDLKQAKVMHKQESIDLLNHHNDIFDTSEEHYNKWFKGNNEQQ